MYRAPIGSRHLVVTAVSNAIVARDRRSGAVVWSRELGGSLSWSTRLQVTYDAVVAYGFGPERPADGIFDSKKLTSVLAAFDYATGAERWRTAVHENIWSATLLVDEEDIFLADDAALVCFRLADGQPLWISRVAGTVDGLGRVPVAVGVPGLTVQGDAR